MTIYPDMPHERDARSRRARHADALTACANARARLANELEWCGRMATSTARGASATAWLALRKAQTLRMLGLGRLPR